jgi:hypothetical protein
VCTRVLARCDSPNALPVVQPALLTSVSAAWIYDDECVSGLDLC